MLLMTAFKFSSLVVVDDDSQVWFGKIIKNSRETTRNESELRYVSLEEV